MHPAFSVLVFTVCSGAGYGLLSLAALIHISGLELQSREQMLITGIAGLILIALGLCSSTFHLANPKNAWRSFVRFRTSWLSREAVFAILHFPTAIAFLTAVWQAQGHALIVVMGVLTIILSVITLYSTAMIYASLKTIRQWHTPLTVSNFLLLGFATGAVALVGIQATYGVIDPIVLNGAVVLLLLALGSKLLYFRELGKPALSTVNSATRLGHSAGAVRLLETGHSADNFLQKEFVYQVGPKTTTLARQSVCLLGCLVPALLIVAGSLTASFIPLYFSFVCALLGVLIERWLFFVEAKHVVRLYYGESIA